MYAISTLGDIGSIGEAITGASALAALGLAARELRVRRGLERKRAVAAHAEKINSKEVYGLIAESVEYWGVAETERDARWAEWRTRPRAEQHDMVLAMNVFETVAAQYNQKLLHRPTAQRLLGDASLDYWNQVGWFVKRYQQLDEHAFVEWERMNQDIARTRRAEPTAESDPETAADTPEEEEESVPERGRPWKAGDLFLTPAQILIPAEDAIWDEDAFELGDAIEAQDALPGEEAIEARDALVGKEATDVHAGTTAHAEAALDGADLPPA